MELHRIPILKEGQIDPVVFNNLYKQTERLRKKLANDIDHTKYGVSKDIILSWFDDKFIQVYVKYHQQSPEYLLGFIISSLQMFKLRILRKGYSRVNIYKDIVTLGEFNASLENLPDSYEDQFQEEIDWIIAYLKKSLSPEAWEIFQLDLYPPEELLRLSKSKKKVTLRGLILYLDLPDDRRTLNFLKGLRKEVERCKDTLRAKVKEFSLL